MDDEAERLHHNAMLGLAGMLPAAAGEEAIAALLRSSVDIDPIMREWLADTIAPKGKRLSSVRLRLANLDEGKFAREMRTRLEMLKRGDLALKALKNGLSWDEALSAAASECRCSKQTIEKGITYAKRYEEWCAGFGGNRIGNNPRYLAWQQMFHAAAISGCDPSEYMALIKAGMTAISASRST